MQIRIDDAAFAYVAGEAVLRNVSLSLTTGWTGLVGANGAGKSTLLAGIAGTLSPSSGTVVRDPDPMMVITLEQRTTSMPAAVESFAWEFDADALRWKSRLGLGDDEPGRWPTLSPGQRRRWQVAAALYARPHALLLDEPTNHLDTAALDDLVDALALFDGIGVLIAHDRALLDRLCEQTVRVARGTATAYTGGYSDAREVWRAEEERQREQLERLQAERRKERRALAQQRSALQSAERQRSSSARMNSVRDSDARSTAAKARADHGATVAAREAGRLRDRLARVDDALADTTVTREATVDLRIAGDTARKPVLARLDDATLCAGDHVVLSGVSIELARDARWWVRGPNGAGKSTLLRGIRDALTVPDARVLDLRQEEGDAFTARDDLALLPPDERGEVLTVAAALGVDVDGLLRSARWSPGEARKVALALAIRREVWVMLLDEPTNHLDLPSQEKLWDALASYDGALVLVSHDSHGGEVTDEQVLVADGVVTREAAR